MELGPFVHCQGVSQGALSHPRSGGFNITNDESQSLQGCPPTRYSCSVRRHQTQRSFTLVGAIPGLLQSRFCSFVVLNSRTKQCTAHFRVQTSSKLDEMTPSASPSGHLLCLHHATRERTQNLIHGSAGRWPRTVTGQGARPTYQARAQILISPLRQEQKAATSPHVQDLHSLVSQTTSRPIGTS